MGYMTTETMREAVARAICEAGGRNQLHWWAYAGEADAAIRTVLERPREPSEAMWTAGQAVDGTISAGPVWQAMLDTAAREVGR